MSAILASIQALANQAAETAPDMNEAQKGGGGSRLLPVGYAFGRLVEYIEFGQQPQEFNGKAKDAAMEVQLGFALWGEGYTNDDGTPYIIRPYPMALSRNEKARAYLLFKALNWKGTAKHFAQLLGEGFLVKIVHEEKSKSDKTIVSRIDLKGFLPPLDPVTKTPYPIPAAPDDAYRVFLWDYPSLEAWDALHIDGTGQDGKSKNFVQDTILSAVDFAGSALEALLLQTGKPINRPVQAATPAAPAVPTAGPALPAAPAPAAVSAPVVPAMPVAAMPAVPAAVPNVQAASAPAVVAPTVPSMPSLPAMPVMPVAA